MNWIAFLSVWASALMVYSIVVSVDIASADRSPLRRRVRRAFAAFVVAVLLFSIIAGVQIR